MTDTKAPSPADAARRIVDEANDQLMGDCAVREAMPGDALTVAAAYLSELAKRERMEEALEKKLAGMLLASHSLHSGDPAQRQTAIAIVQGYILEARRLLKSPQ